jgi:hypothetical protein
MPARALPLRCAAGALFALSFAFPAQADDWLLPGADALHADPQLLAAIIKSNHETDNQLPAPGVRAGALIDLAAALGHLGDKAGMKPLLADAIASAPPPNDISSSFTADRLIETCVAAGMNNEAVDVLKRFTSLAGRIDGLGHLGKAYALAGDRADALKTIQVIDTEWALGPQPPVEPVVPGNPVKLNPHDAAFNMIATELENAGDFDDIVPLAEKMPPGAVSFDLLGRAAEAQCKAGKRDAAAPTLKYIQTALADPNRPDPAGLAFRGSVTIAVCGDLNQARAVIAALPVEDKRNEGGLFLVRGLIDAGDFADTHVLLDNGDDAGDLVHLGKAEEKNGRHDAARTTLRLARAAALRHAATGKYDRTTDLTIIADAQMSIGVFPDVADTAAALDPPGRMEVLVRAAGEELKRSDKSFFNATVSDALETYRSDPQGKNMPNNLGTLAEVLAKGGNVEGAAMVLKQMQLDAETQTGWQRMTALRDVRAAQTGLGDTAGAAETERKIVAERAQFKKDLAKAAMSSDPEAAKVARAMLILIDTHYKGWDGTKKSLQRAAAELGNDREKISTLMIIASLYEDKPPADNGLDDALAREDFTAARRAAKAMPDTLKGAALDDIVRSEADAGQYKLAYETALSISDINARLSALRMLIPVKMFVTPGD